MVTLNEIPLSFLKEHSYILHVSGRGDYRYNYGKDSLFPDNLEMSVGEFLDSDLIKTNKSLYSKICRDIDDHGRQLVIKHVILDLYEAVNSGISFEIIRKNTRMPSQYMPVFYASDQYDHQSLKDVFRLCDKDVRAIMGINLSANEQYTQCLKLKEFASIDNDDEFYAQIRNFVNAYVTYASIGSNQSEIFKYKYKHLPFGSDFNAKEMAKQLDISVSAVGNNINKAIDECKSFLLENTIGYFLPASFIERIKHLKFYMGNQSICKKEHITALLGCDIDKQTFSFVCDLFDLKSFEFDDAETFYLRDTVSLKQVRLLLQSMDEYFTVHPLGVTINRIHAELLHGLSQEEKNIAVRIIEISNRFYHQEYEGEIVYFIKWPYLKKISERVARILFESENKELKLSEIIKIYNDKCKRATVKVKRITSISNDREDLIECIGRTGLWRLRNRDAVGECQCSNVEDIIKQYISTLDNDNEIDFDQLKLYLEQRRITNYSDKSLATRLNNLGYKKECKGENIYVLNDTKKWKIEELIHSMAEVLVVAPNRTILRSELIQAVQKKNNNRVVNQGSFSRALEIASELFSVEKVNSKKVLISLVCPSINDIDFSVYEAEKNSPEYLTAVIQTAVDELLRCENVTMSLYDLKNRVEKYVPSDINNNVIYKIFDKEDIFIKSEISPKTITLNLALYKELYSDKTSLYFSDKESSSKLIDEEYPLFGFDWVYLKKMIISNQSNAFSSGASMEHKNNILDKMYDLMRADLRELTPDNQFWKVLDLLNRLYLYPTSCYDRELLSTKLILGVENYLSNLLRINGIEPGEDGLHNKITKSQMCRLLPNRSISEHKINKLIGPVITSRNRYSHTNNEHKHGFNDVLKNISLCLSFYIYIAEYNLAL